MLSIEYIDYYLPATHRKMEEVLKEIETDILPPDFSSKEDYIDYLENVVGLSTVYTEDDRSEQEMLDYLYEKFSQNSKVSPEDIGLIINISEKRYFDFENVGHYIKDRFQLQNAHVISLGGNQCVNLEAGLIYCSYIMQSANLKNILIVGGCKIKSKDGRLAGTFNLMSDAVGIIVVGKNGKIKLKDFSQVTDGAFYLEEKTKNQSSVIIENYKKCILNLFKRNKIDSINAINIPNGLSFQVTQILNYHGFNDEIIFRENIGKGHFAYLDFLINFKDILMQPGLPVKANILSVGFGWCGTTIATIFAIDDQ